jgi:hypothetical protein
VRCRQLRGVEGSGEVGSDHPIELFGRFGEDVAFRRDPGVVDQAIKPAPASHRSGDGRGDLIAAGNIARDERSGGAQFSGVGFAFGQHIGQHNPRALGH